MFENRLVNDNFELLIVFMVKKGCFLQCQLLDAVIFKIKVINLTSYRMLIDSCDRAIESNKDRLAQFVFIVFNQSLQLFSQL
jgi:hypothetical protein